MARPVLVVLARNRRDFQNWCSDSGLSDRDPDVLYAERLWSLRGIGPTKVIRCRGWQEHPESGEIDQYAQVLEQRARQQP